MGFDLLIYLAIAAFLLSLSMRILNEYERGVVFRLGRVLGAKGPGTLFLIPWVDRLTKISLRTITMDVDSQDVITKDNVSVKVNAVVYFKVIDPIKAILEIENYYFATSQLSQTTLRSVLGQVPLDELLAEREIINKKLQDILDHQAASWGIKISLVEVKNIDVPKEMQRAMAIEAESERERRAKVISAEGEFQRAAKLAEASNILASSPSALQLAYLQTLKEVAGENATTIIFPVPIDLIQTFMSKKP